MAEDEFDDLMRKLQTDVFVKFYTTENPNAPYLIPRTLLAGQSDYFDTRIQNNERQFTFTSDDAEIWKTYLHWLVEQRLREDMFPIDKWPNIEFAAECYVLGEQYGLKAFQDEIMLYLLHCPEYYGRRWEWLGVDGTLLAFQKTPNGSKLRDLLVEEANRAQAADGTPFGLPMDSEDILKLEEVGFFRLFIRKWANDDYLVESRFGDNCEAKFVWKNYMVGSADQYEVAQLKQTRIAEKHS